MLTKKLSSEFRISFYLGFFLLFITGEITLIFYLNTPFAETAADTSGYLNGLHQLQTAGNPVDAFRLPTYSLFLLVVYAVAGQGNLMAVSIAQGLLFICATEEIYLLTLLITRRKWLSFFVGLLIGTNVILISYSKPIMTEGLSLWLLTTIMLCVVAFLKTFRYRFFWISSACLVFLLFTRPEWILLPCLLFPYIVVRARKKLSTRAIILRATSALIIIYLIIGSYIVANALINNVASLSTVSNMNLIGKIIQYHMQDETPYNPSLSHIYDQFIRQGETSPYQIIGKAPILGLHHAQASADFARDIILHHPVQFLVDSVPLFFTSLYHYYPVRIAQHNGAGPYDKFIKPVLSLQQFLYTTNIFFPLCALAWLILCFYRKTRQAFCVQAIGLLVLTVIYAVVITTLGGYYESDYMRVHIVFDPLITLVIWCSFGLGIYQLGSCVSRRKLGFAAGKNRKLQ